MLERKCAFINYYDHKDAGEAMRHLQVYIYHIELVIIDTVMGRILFCNTVSNVKKNYIDSLILRLNKKMCSKLSN